MKKVKRFIYPTTFGNKPSLRIDSTTEDGRVWFGITEAIQNYIEDNGMELNHVEWCLWNGKDFDSINASTIEDWEKQYNKLRKGA